MFAWPQSPRNARVTGRSRRGSPAAGPSAMGQQLAELGRAEGVVDLVDGVEREAHPLELLLYRGGAVGLVHRHDEAGVGVDVQLAERGVHALGDVRAVTGDFLW